MRRVGLLLGLIGFGVGCLLAYDHVNPLLRQAAEAREHQALIDRVPPGYTLEQKPVDLTTLSDEQLEAYRDLVAKGSRMPREWDEQGNLITGAPPDTPAAPLPVSLWRYLPALAFPLLGFFLPWGAIKALTWIGTGFVTSSAK